MAEMLFACCFYGQKQKLVALHPGDSKKNLVEAFGISLENSEDIIIADQQSGASVESKDLFNLVSSLRCPTDLKFVVQSTSVIKNPTYFETNLTSFFLEVRFASPLESEIDPEANEGIINWDAPLVIFNENSAPVEVSDCSIIKSPSPVCDDHPMRDEISEDCNNLNQLSPSEAIFYFGTIDNFQDFVNRNFPGLIQITKGPLGNNDRNKLSKEIIETILDNLPSIK